MQNVSIYLVFAEGIASFLSPCLLPLLPVYLGYLSGEVTEGRSNKRALVINSLIFCLGFSIVFILMGVTASSIGRFLNQYKHILSKIAAVVIILFGLFHMGIIKPGFLYREKRFNIRFRKNDFINSVIFGAAFALGWTPCIGPILGSVLFLAGSSESAAYGAYLLFIYALGLSIPFVITSILVEVISSRLKSIQKYSRVINIVSGLILIILGIALYTGWIQKIAYL
jgi:cytochrome c-type biogenesis protein